MGTLHKVHSVISCSHLYSGLGGLMKQLKLCATVLTADAASWHNYAPGKLSPRKSKCAAVFQLPASSAEAQSPYSDRFAPLGVH